MDTQNMNSHAADSRKLDFKKLLELSTAVHTEIQVLQGKEVTFVVGKTGSGKTTLVNYLLKNKLVKIEDDTGEVLIQLDRMAITRNIAAIGHEFVSETLYPKAFETGRGLLLCDTAGFGDYRSPENNAAACLAVQMIIQSVALVKGIIVVIPVYDFKGRGTALKETLSLLKQLIIDNENCMNNFKNSVVFVLTHAYDICGRIKTHKQIQKLLEKVKTSLEQQINNNPYNANLADSLALCKIMLSSGVQVAIFDPLVKDNNGQFRDNPVGRDNILNFIQQSNGIAKEDIAFRVERIFQPYSDTVCKIAKSFLRFHRVILCEQYHIQQYEKKIESKKIEISKLVEVNSDLEKHGQKNVHIENLKDEQKKIKDEIDSLINLIANIKEEHNEVTIAKDKLENDTTHVLVYTDVYHENAVYGTVLPAVVHSKTFDYSQTYPIAKVDYVCGHYSVTQGSPQEFSEPFYNKDRTHCTLKYTGPSHECGQAEFRVYSEKRYTPDSKCQIKRYEDELENIEMERKELKSELMKARAKERNLSELIIVAEVQNIRDTKSLIESNEKRIEAYNKELEHFSEILKESTRKLELAKHTLKEKENQYEMLTQFNKIVPFEDLTVKTFMFEYKIRDKNFQPVGRINPIATCIF